MESVSRSKRYFLALCAIIVVLTTTGLYLIWTDDFSGYNKYEVLAVSHKATRSEIKKAYRNMALQYHPDKSDSSLSSIRFQHISDAYAVLSDEEKRMEYDRTLQQEKLRQKHHRNHPQQHAMYRPKSMRLPDVIQFILVEVPRRVLSAIKSNLSLHGLFKFLVVLGTVCFVVDNLLSLTFAILGYLFKLPKRFFNRKEAAAASSESTDTNRDKALLAARERQQAKLIEANARRTIRKRIAV